MVALCVHEHFDEPGIVVRVGKRSPVCAVERATMLQRFIMTGESCSGALCEHRQTACKRPTRADARHIPDYLAPESVSLILTSPPYANLLNRKRKNKSRRGDERFKIYEDPALGWAQLSSLASDAYATGQALVALKEAGGMAATDAAYELGTQFLLNTQLEDGSWYVRSRSIPFQPYFESGFPHGRDQWISASATNWASITSSSTTSTTTERCPPSERSLCSTSYRQP